MAGVGPDLDEGRHGADEGGVLVEQSAAPDVLFEVDALSAGGLAERGEIMKFHLGALDGQGL